jgi:Ca2+-binding RTX toxin-like protein
MSRNRWTARMAVVTLLASATIVALTSTAYAAAEYSAWVDGGVLHYEYATGAPTSHVVVRTNGATFTIDDDFGIYAGPGCTYPTQDGSFVTCTGVGLPGAGYVIIHTGPTNDSIDFYPTGAYTTIGGYLDAGAGNDTILGSDGGDKMFGGPGDDYLNGWGGGTDFLSGGPGADTLYGGAGFDIVEYTDHTTGVVASADGVVGDDGTPGEGDTIGTDVEGIEGSSYDDVLTGNAADNLLIGCSGSDHLNGLGGNDELSGDLYGIGDCTGPIGADVLIGGPGTDTVDYNDRSANLVVDLSGSAANDGQAGEHDTVDNDVENIVGGTGDDILIGNAAKNVIDGGGGNDKIYGLDGDDSLNGNNGDDFLSGGNGADSLNGSDGTDRCDLGADGLTAIACES